MFNCKSLTILIYFGSCFWSVAGEYPNSIFEWKSEIGWASSRIIPDHHYVSAFLNEGISKRFLYMNENDPGGNVLSVLVTPCTSVLLWSVKFYSSNPNTTTRVNREPDLLKSFRTERSATFYDLKSRRGVYIIQVKALYSDSYVHLYAANGREPVRIPSNFIENSDINPGVPKPKVSIRRLRGNRLQLKWEPSAYNPQHVKYCIVVNSHRDYSSLCGAQGVKYGVLPPDLMHVSYYYFPYDKPTRYKLPPYRDQVGEDDDISQSLMTNPSGSRVHRHQSHHQPPSGDSFEERERARDLIIGCVNQKTNYILNNLREGKLYYFNVFIKDSSTNFTYPYLRTTVKYETPKNLTNGITDAKAMKLWIGRDSMDGKGGLLVKFNVKKPCSLRMYVMPCGGTISYQLIHAYKSIIESKPIDSLDILKIAMPEKGRYYIRLRQSQTLHNNNSTLVELYVSKRNKRFPLPKLPQDTQIIQDLSERDCESVKIQWLPSPDPRDNEYCIFLKEEKNTLKSRKRNFKKPNQCDVERSLNSDPSVTHSMCIQRSLPKIPGQYLFQTIGGLHPDKMYIIQVILRRHKGKALSYDLTQVSTSNQCTDHYNSSELNK